MGRLDHGIDSIIKIRSGYYKVTKNEDNINGSKLPRIRYGCKGCEVEKHGYDCFAIGACSGKDRNDGIDVCFKKASKKEIFKAMLTGELINV